MGLSATGGGGGGWGGRSGGLQPTFYGMSKVAVVESFACRNVHIVYAQNH